MMARYLADMEKQSRERLAAATDLVAKFIALAASKDVTLGADSFEYIQTIGIVAKAPGIARTLLGPIRAERDGVLSFNQIASRFPPCRHYEGYFAGPDFILMAHPCYRRGMHPVFIDVAAYRKIAPRGYLPSVIHSPPHRGWGKTHAS
ncbi:hypothetical protein [Pseudomonas sp. BN102]|uniref:hypothetical protein n=1 Tax=Pseudomonas sp. BN102 TaxID=2567886 RepID=UPI002454C3E0|nr:hypothetical protein [Pseudomonas sp. BN102]